MGKTFVTIALAALAISASAAPVTLTEKTFDKEVFDSGKAAFVKFFAPWCGHCKAMKPAWDKLGGEHKGSKTVLIGDVDCTTEKNLCSKYGVKGFPTIKYFTGATAADGDKYEGGRDFDALQKFAKENLGPSCDPSHKDLCTAEQAAEIDAKMALSIAELTEEADKHDADIKAAEKELEDLLTSLQSQYEAGKTKKEDAVAELSPKLRLARSVLKAKKDAEAEL